MLFYINLLFLFIFIILSGPWQVMLKQSDNSYACVAESETRFTLGEVCWTKVLELLAVLSFVWCFGLTVARNLDQRWTTEGPWTTGGARKLTRISPQGLQGSPFIFVILFYIFPSIFIAAFSCTINSYLLPHQPTRNLKRNLLHILLPTFFIQWNDPLWS